MSIASEITRISGNVADAYTAANAKGATMPITQNSDNLATTIATIPTGTTPTGTKSITANGVYDVTDFASADVQVPTTAPAYYIEKTVDANGKLISGTNIINLNGVTDVGAYVLAHAYDGANFPANTSIDLSGLTTISGQNACSGMFQSCTGITSVNLSGLTTISAQYACQDMFASCRELTSVDLSSLTTISGSGACQNMFNGCSSLTSIRFPLLATINRQFSVSYASMFGYCSLLESVEFGGLTASTFASKKDQIAYLFNNTTGRDVPNGCTVHFPSNFDPSDPNHTFDASTLTGYPTFGGSASYIHVAFDLPATE